MSGAKSPYADDPHHYKWNWCQDCYVNVETGRFCEYKQMFSEEGRAVIKDLGMVPDDGWSREDAEAMLLTFEPMTVELASNGKPIAVHVVHDDYGSAVFTHPAWEGIDWEQDEYACGC